MAFWNRKRDDKIHAGSNTDLIVKTLASLQKEVQIQRREIAALGQDAGALRDEVAELRARDTQPVPTNGGPRAGSAVQDWLPVVDRLQELLLVQMGNADLAQAFGTHARQRELREAEEPISTAWAEPDESTYENL